MYQTVGECAEIYLYSILFYEALNADQRLAERAARKQWLDELPRTTDVQGIFKEGTASLVEAKELVEDSLAVDPGAVTAAVDGPALRSVTARRRAAEIISKLINKTKKKNIAYLTGGALAAFM